MAWRRQETPDHATPAALPKATLGVGPSAPTVYTRVLESRLPTKERIVKRFLFIPLLVVLAVAATAMPASAARTAQAQPTIVVSPSAPVAGDMLAFSGCGYKANTSMEVVIKTPWSLTGGFIFPVRTDAAGCWVIPLYEDGTSLILAVSGDYVVRAYAGLHLDVNNGAPHAPLAELVFTVV